MQLPGGAHAAWVELLIVYMWHHEASMFANICGILAGYLYCLLAGLTVDIPLVGRVDPAALGLGAAPLAGMAGGFRNPLRDGNFFDNLFGGGGGGGDAGAGAWGGGGGGGAGAGGRGRDWGANTTQQRAGQTTGGQTTGGQTTGGGGGNAWGGGGANAWGGAAGSAAPRGRAAAPSPRPSAPSANAVPSPAPPPEYTQRLANGAAVRVFGLVSASQHNGKIGKIVNFDHLTARYHVMLAPGTTVALKDGNIMPAGGEGVRRRESAGPVELD